MKLIPNLSDTIKGILLIVAGILLLCNTLGFTTELLHSIVLFGAIAMILIGILMADVHKKIYVLIAKNEKPKDPEDL